MTEAQTVANRGYSPKPVLAYPVLLLYTTVGTGNHVNGSTELIITACASVHTVVER